MKTDEEWAAYDKRMAGYDRRGKRLFVAIVVINALSLAVTLAQTVFLLTH